MMQLSRPFQIVLVAFCLFAAVWFFALRSHSSSTSGGGSSASSSPAASSTSSPAAQPTSPGTPYHGSAPGVAGLTRAIEKAQGAVNQSEHNAKQLREKEQAAAASATPGSSAAASGAAPSTSPSAAAAHTATPNSPAAKSTATLPKSTATQPKSAPTAARGATGAPAAQGTGPSKATAAPTMQVAVEGALKRGKLVTVLFWNPKGVVDQTVHRELQSVGRSSRGKVAVFSAVASQVGSFGSFTKAVQVNATPTIVIVNPRGRTQTLTGLTDAFSIEQAIGEANKQK
jgi:hypothetical protein